MTFLEKKSLQIYGNKHFGLDPNYRSNHTNSSSSSWKSLYYPRAFQQNKDQKDMNETTGL